MAWRARLALLVATAAAVPGQGVVSARAGLVNHVRGLVFLNDQQIVLNRERLPQLKDGDSLSTEAGRAELLLGPGVIVRLAESSRVRMIDTQRSDARLEILEGTSLVEVISLTKDSSARVIHGASVTEFRRPGLYRFEVSLGELDVYFGEARVDASGKRATAKRGDVIRLGDRLSKTKFDDKKRTDSIHDWAARRSFLLYNSDPEARRTQRNWTEVALGWVWSPSYRRRYYSEQVARATLQRAVRDARQQADFSQIEDRLAREAAASAAAAAAGSEESSDAP